LAENENVAEEDPLISFRLGAVRAGVQATILTLVLLVTFQALPGHGEIDTIPYVLILVSAAAGLVGVLLLPWRRLFTSQMGIRALYTWSALDILLITVAIGFTGGGSSEMFLLYGLTTVFFGAVYPHRGQIGLLAFTYACYLGVLAVTGWHVTAAVVIFRLGAVGIVATMVNFLASELLRHIDSLQRSRSTAERWAGLLSTVTVSTRNMTLDEEPVLERLVSSVTELGFDGAGLAIFDHEAGTFVVTHHRGLPLEYVSPIHSADAALPGLVRAAGRTAVVDEANPLPPGVHEPLREAGFRALVGSPIWVDGWLAGALIGASSHSEQASSQEVDALDLLAGHTGLAIENFRRFEETLHTVERLEELDRLKDDFLATASHEIRTPLTVMLGAGLTLERRWDDLDEPMRLQLLGAMNSNSKTLEGLVSSLLDFARLGSETEHLNFGPCSVDALVESVATRLGPLFADHVFSTEIGHELVVEGDPGLLERILDNLLANAAKHTPPGTHVRLSAKAEDGTVIVAVEDDGPGISREDVPHLGERFYRGGDRNSRPTKGLGLGLALVREALELHGSALEIESTPGAGSRFAFRLLEAALEDNRVINDAEEQPSTTPS
jgi:signal transduction histidine kinase